MAALAPAGAAWAQGPAPVAPEPSIATPLHPLDARMIEAAKQLVAQGRYEEALAVLARIAPKTVPAAIEIEFLRAQIAEILGDLEAATTHYRNILADHPELVRVRLELARVLYRLEDDDAARHHFELVLGVDPPPAVRHNIERFLTSMRNRRRLKLQYGVSLVPDTNVNSATDSGRVNIYGLPFRLSDDARRTSGIGLAVNEGIDYTYPIFPGFNLETGASGRYLDYSGSDFDDLSAFGYLGVRRYFGTYDVAAAAIANRRWYGNEGYSVSFGGRADVGYRFTPQWTGRLRFSGQSVDYDDADQLDGTVYQFQAEAHYAIDVESRVYLLGGTLLENTEVSAYSNIAPFFGFGYQRELPYRITVGVQPLVYIRLFDEPLAAFGATREDVSLQFQASLTYRTDLLFGFAPTLTYTYTYNDSNIGLYDYDRHRLEVGLTREF